MLKLWGYTTSSQSPLFSQQGDTHHIIVNCDVGLRQGRYTWRHDSNIEPVLKTLVADTNQRHPQNLYRSFVPAGKERPPNSQPKGYSPVRMIGASSWITLTR